MSSKQQEVTLQRWRGEIGREARDLASLDQTLRRALADSHVRDDPTIQSMIRAEAQRRRSEIEEKERSAQAAMRSREQSPRAEPATPAPLPVVSPQEVLESFDRLVQSLCTSLEQRNEAETQKVFKQMRALHAESPDVIPAATMATYERRLQELRAHIKQLTEEIATLSEQAVSAAREGQRATLKQSMARLTAIHAAHPRLLDESGLDSIRHNTARAGEERHQHQQTTKTLLERERVLTVEIKKLAVVVRDFHKVACSSPPTSAAFREAEAAYLRAVQTVHAFDSEWFTGVVLEMADLLAEWAVPPPGAAGQIERFLDSIEAGLKRIRAEMREIRNKQDTHDGSDGASGRR